MPSPTQTSAPLPHLIGQQIALWPVLENAVSLSPVKPSAKDRDAMPASPVAMAVPGFRLTHKRTMSPAPAADPSPVFQPLRPAKTRKPIKIATVTSTTPTSSITPSGTRNPATPSSLTFGPRSSKTESLANEEEASPSPTFRKAHTRQRSSLVLAELKNNKTDVKTSMPIGPEAKRVLGLTGTMGASETPAYLPEELDVDDPDSDIPDELQVILSEGSGPAVDDTMSYRSSCIQPPPASPGTPPEIPLPSPLQENVPEFRIRLFNDEANHGDIDTNSSSEDDTKKSFDFTGEIRKLNESGVSERRSFVEQLETAFRTPAKIDLQYDFNAKLKDGFLSVGPEAPPVPKVSESVGQSVKKVDSSTGSSSAMDAFSASRLVDMPEPTMFRGPDSSSSTNGAPEAVPINDSALELSNTSVVPRPSRGQLNTEFKFGGTPPLAERQQTRQAEKPLTLSDIIPPPSHTHSHNRSHSHSSVIDEDSSVLRSIFAMAAGIPTPAHVPPLPRQRLDSDSSSKRRARDLFNSTLVILDMILSCPK
jgi:serine/arginine repetitive matrix protein 2